MKKQLASFAVFAVAFLSISAVQVQAGIIRNGGFESADIDDGWYYDANPKPVEAVKDVVSQDGNHYKASEGAYMASLPTSSALLNNMLTWQAGDKLQFKWLITDENVAATFLMMENGMSVSDHLNLTGEVGKWHTFTFTFGMDGIPFNQAFGFQGFGIPGKGHLLIDDVQLLTASAISEPFSLGLMVSVLLLWRPQRNKSSIKLIT
ncbi:hypothetical protein [Zooshikella harenae]|uniref:PEP-CTERM sorting domain-containing protein n=1 Tax=Zooshikella harenae TaxID=2827238 RepID=A0ABS5ZAS4_9GAMM|nr:hypothetical protein [Zooshikella harenae]MBU2711161.1 hypothetical protein [Zooshikella harenae]